MTKAVHLVLQGKGGVGKSVVARLLAEYMIHTERDYQGFDADAVNQSFAAVNGLNVRKVDLLDGAKIDTRKFDTLMVDIVANNEKAVIIDSGASSFLPMMGYIETAHVIDTLLDGGFEVFIHTVVKGGPSKNDTFAGFEQIAQRFGDLCNVVVWANPFFGLGMNDWVRPHFMYSGSMDNFWLVMAVRFGIPGFLFLAVGYAWAIFLIMRRKFDSDVMLSNIRRAWVFTFLGLSFTLVTVHVWATIYSFVFFMFGAGIWLVTAQPGDQDPDTPVKDDQEDSTPVGRRFSRFPATPRAGNRAAPPIPRPAYQRQRAENIRKRSS